MTSLRRTGFLIFVAGFLCSFVSPARSAAPVITSASTARGVVGVAFTYKIKATGSPTKFKATGIPAGLKFHPGTGLINGAPLTVGVFTLVVKAAGPSGTASRRVKVTVVKPTILARVQNASPKLAIPILCDATNRTIYSYDPDTTSPQTSPNFPDAYPWYWVTVTGTPAAGPGVTAKLGTKIKDGKRVLTVNGLPAYYYSLDMNAGDADGWSLPSWGAFNAKGTAL